MTNPNASNYRDIGDVPLAVITALLTAAKSPMVPTLSATYAAVQGNTALFFAQAWMENQWETTGIVIKPEDHNPVSLRPWTEDPTATVTGDLIDSVTRAKVSTIKVPPGAIGAILEPDKSMMLRFSSDAAGAREWQRRIITDPTYKGGVYVKAVTLEQMIDIYCPPGDIHPVTGNDANATYAPTVRAKLAEFAAAEAKLAPVTQTGDTTVATTPTFGRVPFPSFTDRQSVTKNKPEGVGWNNLGERAPRFIVLHRMEGNLQGTDQYFGMASTGALTDYGIGTAGIDGASRDGTIYQWNNPRGYRAGWASGPVSAPYGDGLNWLNWGYAHGYDVNIPNVCGVSIEISGDYNDPLSDTAFKQLTAFVAYWFDQLKVPYDKAPIGPDGISCVTWHQEWTIGTGKICPGPIVMNRTQELIDAAAVILKQYQTAGSGTSVTPPPPVTVPPATYAKPSPIAALAPYGIKDKDTAKAIVTAEGTKFTWVADTYKVTKATKRYQFASLKAPSVGPDLKVDETLDILWTFTAANGSLWGYTADATRIDLACVERVKD